MENAVAFGGEGDGGDFCRDLWARMVSGRHSSLFPDAAAWLQTTIVRGAALVGKFGQCCSLKRWDRLGITMLIAENHGTGFVWKAFMKNKEAQRGMELAGFRAQHEVHTHHYSAKNKRAPEGALVASWKSRS
jgi:hypothetical protein